MITSKDSTNCNDNFKLVVDTLRTALRERGPLPVRNLIGYIGNLPAEARDIAGHNECELERFIVVASNVFRISQPNNVVHENRIQATKAIIYKRFGQSAYFATLLESPGELVLISPEITEAYISEVGDLNIGQVVLVDAEGRERKELHSNPENHSFAQWCATKLSNPASNASVLESVSEISCSTSTITSSADYDPVLFKEVVDILRDALKSHGPMPVKNLIGCIHNKHLEVRQVAGHNESELENFLKGIPNVFEITETDGNVQEKTLKGERARITRVMGKATYFAVLIKDGTEHVYIPADVDKASCNEHSTLKVNDVLKVDAYGKDPRELPKKNYVAQWAASSMCSIPIHENLEKNTIKILQSLRDIFRDKGPMTLSSLLHHIQQSNPQLKQILETVSDYDFESFIYNKHNVFEISHTNNTVDLRKIQRAKAKVTSVSSQNTIASLCEDVRQHVLIKGEIRKKFLPETKLEEGQIISIDGYGVDPVEYENIQIEQKPDWNATSIHTSSLSKPEPDRDSECEMSCATSTISSNDRHLSAFFRNVVDHKVTEIQNGKPCTSGSCLKTSSNIEKTEFSECDIFSTLQEVLLDHGSQQISTILVHIKRLGILVTKEEILRVVLDSPDVFGYREMIISLCSIKNCRASVTNICVPGPSLLAKIHTSSAVKKEKVHVPTLLTKMLSNACNHTFKRGDVILVDAQPTNRLKKAKWLANSLQLTSDAPKSVSSVKENIGNKDVDKTADTSVEGLGLANTPDYDHRVPYKPDSLPQFQGKKNKENLVLPSNAYCSLDDDNFPWKSNKRYDKFKLILDMFRCILEKEGEVPLKTLHEMVQNETFIQDFIGDQEESLEAFILDFSNVFALSCPEKLVQLKEIKDAYARICNITVSGSTFAELCNETKQQVHISSSCKETFMVGQKILIDAVGQDRREFWGYAIKTPPWKAVKVTICKENLENEGRPKADKMHFKQVIYDPENVKPFLDTMRKALKSKGPQTIQHLYGRIHGMNQNEVRNIFTRFPDVFVVDKINDIVTLNTRSGMLAVVQEVFEKHSYANWFADSSESVYIPEESLGANLVHDMREVLKEGSHVFVDIEPQTKHDYPIESSKTPKWKAWNTKVGSLSDEIMYHRENDCEQHFEAPNFDDTKQVKVHVDGCGVLERNLERSQELTKMDHSRENLLNHRTYVEVLTEAQDKIQTISSSCFSERSQSKIDENPRVSPQMTVDVESDETPPLSKKQSLHASNNTNVPWKSRKMMTRTSNLRPP